MTEIEILKIISSNLTDNKNSSALSNYNVLCNNISYLNTAFKSYLDLLGTLQKNISDEFENDDSLNDEYKDGKDLNSMLPIVNRIIKNGIAIFKKFSKLTMSDVVDNRIRLEAKTFIHYNELVTASRQLVDSMVSDSYQLCLLEPKNINHHVLVSLNSFNKYASKSISNTIFNDELRQALSELEAIPFHQWKNSPITRCEHTSFSSKVNHLSNIFGGFPKESLSEDINNIFKFSSEFTHIGYTSTLFTNSEAADVVFIDNKKRKYSLSMENFSELKYELLETACWALIGIYTPSVLSCLKKIFKEDVYNKFEGILLGISPMLTYKINSRNSKYYFFIVDGLIGSSKDFNLKCNCGEVKVIKPPHYSHEYGCNACGSSFTLIALNGNPTYIFTNTGPVKVVGAKCPDIEDLSEHKRKELFESWMKSIQNGEQFLF